MSPDEPAPDPTPPPEPKPLDWPGYFAAVDGKPPHRTLLDAARQVEARVSGRPPFAVDLGCGPGRDTLELLRRGWRVLAIDQSEEAIGRLRAAAPAESLDRLQTRVSGLAATEWPSADLVNASLALPFVRPEEFELVWPRIVASLPSGGLFAGHLFGDRDDWARLPGRSHHRREEVERLLQDFVADIEEQDFVGPTACGPQKRWHMYHVVARKR